MSEKKRLILFQLTFLFVLLLSVEIVLRLIGYSPGDMKPKWLNFHPVDTLIEFHNFYTNDEGILVANHKENDTSIQYINSAGFRTKEFLSIDSTKRKILFIGDSFTWGFSAEPIVDHCFVDLIRKETNYEVINLGIPGADPPQYAELAKKYIPLIKPDIVLVIFFLGNDLMRYDRTVGPRKALHYFTNAGVINADIDGIHFNDAYAAYHYVTQEKYYLFRPRNVFECMISRSSLLSRLYSVRFRIEEKLSYESQIKDTRITKKYLHAIKNIADKNKVPIMYVLIPEIKEADMNVKAYTEKYADILNDSVLNNLWLIPSNSKSYFNNYPDAHLNNAGHRFYANYLEEFLRKSSERQ